MVMIQREMVAHSWTMITMNAVEHSRAVHAGGQGWSASGSSAGQPDRAAGPRTSWARSLWAPEAFSCGRDIKPRADGKCGAGAGGVVEERSLSQNSGSTASDVGLLEEFEDAGPCEMAEYPNVPQPDARSRDYEKMTTPFCISQGCCDRCREAEVSPVCSGAAGSGAVGSGAVGSGAMASGSAGSGEMGYGADGNGHIGDDCNSDSDCGAELTCTEWGHRGQLQCDSNGECSILVGFAFVATGHTVEDTSPPTAAATDMSELAGWGTAMSAVVLGITGRRHQKKGAPRCATGSHIPHTTESTRANTGPSLEADADACGDLQPILAPGTASGYRGVSYDRDRRSYRAVAITKERKRVRLGDFASAWEAAMCYTRHVQRAQVHSTQACPTEAVDHDGVTHQLFLKPGTQTGYKGVEMIAAKRNLGRPFRARHEKCNIGYFSTAMEAAIAYSKYVSARGASETGAIISELQWLATEGRNGLQVATGAEMGTDGPRDVVIGDTYLRSIDAGVGAMGAGTSHQYEGSASADSGGVSCTGTRGVDMGFVMGTNMRNIGTDSAGADSTGASGTVDISLSWMSSELMRVDPDAIYGGQGGSEQGYGKLSCSDLGCSGQCCGNQGCSGLSGSDLGCGEQSCGELGCGNLSRGDLSYDGLSCSGLSCSNLCCRGLGCSNQAHTKQDYGDTIGGEAGCSELSCGDPSYNELSCSDLDCNGSDCGNLGSGDLVCGDQGCGDLELLLGL